MDRNILFLSAKLPVMLLGAPGVGKTAVVTRFAQELGADLVDIRLSAETPGSFEGKDYISPKSGDLQKARAWWLQRIDGNRAENRPTVLFFDEYTNAPDALQQLAYAPFNERRLHGVSFDYSLRDGQPGLYVFGAGNRVEDETGAREMVHAPNAELKRLQGRILRGLLVKLPVSAYATAYIRKKDPVQNALPHVGKRYLLKLDITDFFGSIRFAKVYGAAFHTGHFPKQVGVLLTGLCCRQGVLPQGAPTSPALSNLVLRNFDNNLGKWCASHDIAYTRYCDDMTFSSDRPLYAVYRKARGMLEQMGFRLNERKTRFITNANRQSVTGLTVNAKVSVSRDYKRRLRQEVHYVLKFGLAEHILRSVPGALTEGGMPNAGKYYRSLVGRVGYVLQIEPENAWFRNAQDRLKSDSRLKGEIALWSM